MPESLLGNIAACLYDHENNCGKQGWHSLDILSRGLQDAITFTRKLGIPYLWIDSLCTIQDDGMDWHREAAEMATIYEHSVLTLAATDTRDGEGSLFSKPRTAVYMGIEVLRSKEGDPSFQIYAHRKTTHQHYLEDYPLLRWAWVYQERLLSSRMLHFTPTELMWEFNDTMQCACSDSDGVFDHSKFDLAWWGRRPKMDYAQMFLASATDSTYNARISWR